MPLRTGPSLPALLGIFLLLVWLCSELWDFARRQQKWVLLSFGWFVIALAPVAQLVVYPQTYQADRYLVLACNGPCLLLGYSFHRLLKLLKSPFPALVTRRVVVMLSALLLLAITGVSAERAWLFSDSIRLLPDENLNTSLFPFAPYQLGKAYEKNGNEKMALSSYLLALDRLEQSGRGAAEAVTNAAQLLTHQGKLKDAEKKNFRPAEHASFITQRLPVIWLK